MGGVDGGWWMVWVGDSLSVYLSDTQPLKIS